jgi:hypothetical protein
LPQRVLATHGLQEPVPTSLLKLSGDHVSRAVKMFSGILKYTGDSGERIDVAGQVEIAQKLLHQGLKRPELKDELYMQLLKQTRGNPNPQSRACAWELFHLVSATMPPSKARRMHAVVRSRKNDISMGPFVLGAVVLPTA